VVSKLPRALAVALAVSLGACTLEPHYHRPQSPVPPLGAGAPEQRAQAAADTGWREFFPDPQLQELIALALANNRDLRVAVLNVESAQARYRVQRAELFPTIAATGIEQVERFPSGVFSLGGGGAAAAGSSTTPATAGGTIFRFFNAGVGFTNYELDVFGRIRSLDHAALQQYFNSVETRRSVQLTLVAEVANAYLAVLADQTLLDITRDTLKSQEESYALTQRMFGAGTTTELALSQAETTVDTARANLALYNRQIAEDRDALQLLLGAPIPDDVDFSRGLDRGRAVGKL
jgi:outer membrane protein, multidrug efflux system